MRYLIALLCRLSVCVLTRSVLVAGLGFCMVSSVSAEDIVVTEQTFGCILDWPKVRNTYFKHSDPEKLKEAFRRSIPLGRIGAPADLPGAICFFASEDAAFITGQVLNVSGGLTMAG